MIVSNVIRAVEHSGSVTRKSMKGICTYRDALPLSPREFDVGVRLVWDIRLISVVK